MDTLPKPENKATLAKVLTYPVVAGKMSAADLTKAIKTMLKTVAGGTSAATIKGGKLMLTGDAGGRDAIERGDLCD